MRRVTAKQLHAMGVKCGPDLALPSDSRSKVGVAKAQILFTLERFYGDDVEKWIRALRKVKQTATYREATEHSKIALLELLAELEEQAKKEA